MSGPRGGSAAGPLPDVMAAAVYRSPGVIAVEERPVPRPAPDQVVVRVHACGICGSDIHQLRDGWGFKPGAVAGHEWSGDHRRSRRRRHGLVGRRAGGRRRLTALRHLPALPRGEAVPVREPQQHDHRPHRRRLRRVRRGAGGGRVAAARRAPAPSRRARRAAVGGAARDHPFGCRPGRHGDGVRGRSHRRLEHRHPARQGHRRHHRGRAPRRSAPPGLRPRCHGRRRPGRPRGVPLLGAGAYVVARRARRPGVLGAPGRDRSRLSSARAVAASWSWWAPGSTTPSSTSTA